MNIFNKIIFLLKKPKAVVVFGPEAKVVKEAFLLGLKNHFKINKELFIFEVKENNFDKFFFFLKNSRQPILAITDPEQCFLIKKAPCQTYSILNCDQEKTRKEIEGYNNFKIIKTGFSPKNDIFASDIKTNGGTSFKVNYKGSFVPFRFEKELNRKEINIILFVVSAGMILGLNLVEISQLFDKKLIDRLFLS